MPSISDILDAVSAPSLIKDEVIRNGKFERSSRGVIYYSGGFTVVFPVEVTGRKWAFRCWHTEMGNVRKRFKIISDYVNQLRSPYFCDFYYCDSGLIVDGKTFPTTRMTWVEGENIHQYIARNVDNKKCLLSLANKFLSMVEFLHSNHIAHGDLQHGNIIVSKSGDIKLVDYDSLFVPGLEGESDIITGKAEFQHPKRRNLRITSEKLDYFSELAIYLSIIAIAHKPSLIQDFSIDDSLLFQSSDWEDFENSLVYKALKAIDYDDVSVLTDILADYLKENDVNNLEPFTTIWKDRQKKPVIHSFVCGNVDGFAFRGMESTIEWELENVSKIEFNSNEVPSDQRVCKFVFTEDTDISLLVRNGIHTVELKKHVRVIDAPQIYFSADKSKLRKTKDGIETAKLSWSVVKADSVVLKHQGSVLSTAKESSGFLVSPQKDTVYKLVAIGLDGKTEFQSEIKVIVREPADVDFQSDKLFTLPDVPITISWTVSRAKNVRLNNNVVGLKGQSIFTPQSDEEFVLSYEDDFGESAKRLNVRMLPLPIVKSILVDTPNINKALGIQYSSPQFETIPDIPLIESAFINLTIPEIPDLPDSGFFVELPKTPKERLSKEFSRIIKRLFRKVYANDNKKQHK